MRCGRLGLLGLVVAALAVSSGCTQQAEPVEPEPSAVDSASPTASPEAAPTGQLRDSEGLPVDPSAQPSVEEIQGLLASEPWREAGDGNWVREGRDHGLVYYGLEDFGCRRPLYLDMQIASAYADLYNGVTGDRLHVVISTERLAEDFVREVGAVFGECALDTPVLINPDGNAGDGETLFSVLHGLELPSFADEQACMTFDILEPDGVTQQGVTHTCHAASGVIRLSFNLEEAPDESMSDAELVALFSDIATEAFALQDAP